jgi:hypothetical protein
MGTKEINHDIRGIHQHLLGDITVNATKALDGSSIENEIIQRLRFISYKLVVSIRLAALDLEIVYFGKTIYGVSIKA